MLEKPSGGWTRVSIGGFSSRASYLTDVPYDMLNAFTRFFSENRPQTVYFDGEGLDFYITFSWDIIFMLDGRGDTNYLCHQDEVKIDDVVREVISDLEEHLDDWKAWSEFYDTADKLEPMLLELKELVSIRRKGFC